VKVSRPLRITKTRSSAGIAWSLPAGLFCLLVAGCAQQGVHAGTDAETAKQTSHSGDETALAIQGKLIFDETPKYASKHVCNRFACNDCHLGSGTAAMQLP
jgi:cytochrome c